MLLQVYYYLVESLRKKTGISRQPAISFMASATRPTFSSDKPVKVGRFIPVAASWSVTGRCSPRSLEPSRKGGSRCSAMKNGRVSIFFSPSLWAR